MIKGMIEKHEKLQDILWVLKLGEKQIEILKKDIEMYKDVFPELSLRYKVRLVNRREAVKRMWGYYFNKLAELSEEVMNEIKERYEEV